MKSDLIRPKNLFEYSVHLARHYIAVINDHSRVHKLAIDATVETSMFIVGAFCKEIITDF